MEWIREPNEYERQTPDEAPRRPAHIERCEPRRPAPPRPSRAKPRGRRRRVWLGAPVLAVALAVLAAVFLVRARVGELPEPLRLYALAHGYTVDDYQQKLLELLERNPETKDFVAHYPAEHDKTHEISLTPDGSVPLYLQWDERWGYECYNGDLIALTGCGPCCLSMAATYLTGSAAYDPLTISRWAEAQGYAVAGEGSSWTLFSEGAEQLGLDAVEIGADEQRVRDNLAVGNVIVCVMGAGDFTTDGHFILLTDYDDGCVTVRDPNSIERSEKPWRFADISGQMLALWVLRTVD